MIVRLKLVLVLLVGLVAAGIPDARAQSAAPPAPARVVSINLCTDQLAMLVAAPGQLRSVSFLARDPRASAMAERAKAYPVNSGRAEEVFLRKPDLVLAGTMTTRATVAMLRRLDIPVVEFPIATSLDDVGPLLTRMGAALGREEIAAALRTEFERDLAARTPPPRRDRAALYHANSYTTGSGTLAHSVVEAAGLANIAAELGIEGGGRLPLERLVMAAPDLLIEGDRYDAPALSQEVLDHPALTRIKQDTTGVPVVDAHWICATPLILEAIDRLIRARAAMALASAE